MTPTPMALFQKFIRFGGRSPDQTRPDQTAGPFPEHACRILMFVLKRNIIDMIDL